MRIINRAEFLKMPVGTLYIKYKPYYFEGLEVKEDSGGLDNDWCASELTGISTIKEGDNSGDIMDALDRYVETGESFELEIDGYGRDGGFDDDELFAIYEPQDIQQLIDRLTKLLPQ
jgi:hypothetical protein